METVHEVSGSLNPIACLGQIGVLHGCVVSQSGSDADPEEVADAANVSAGRMDLLEDAVLAQRLGSEVRFGPRELAADGNEAWSAAAADVQEGVDGARPGTCPIVEPRREPDAHRSGQRDAPLVQREPSVVDIGEL